MEIMPLIDAVERFWSGINAYCVGRLLCAITVAFPLLNGKVLEGASSGLMKPFLKYAQRVLKDDAEEILRLNACIQNFLRLVLLYAVVLYAEFPSSFKGPALLAVRSGLAVVVFMGISAILRPFLLAVPALKQFTTVATIEWVVKVCRVFLGSICAITILEWWGVHVAAFLTGLGFLGAAVVLGAQDLFKNLISGFLILAEKRFNHGDWVHVDNFVEGYVESIGFRSTLLRRTDGAPIYVPNARLSDGAIVNFAGINYRRVYWRISLDPEISFSALKRVRVCFDKAISDLPKAPQRPDSAIFVYVDALTETSVDIVLSCFLPFSTMADFLREREAFAHVLTRIVAEAGTHFVLPKFTLSSNVTGGNIPEVFVPPLEETHV